jgi:hypothetical protein
MTTVPRRTLTINFERSITAGVPNSMEIVVIPLSEPNAPALDGSLVGGPQTQVIVLANATTPVTFSLVPTDSPFLDQRVVYRIAWRERFMGRQYTHDFVMPDANVNFADLDDLGAVLGGVTYLQQTDRSVPGGVAGLNNLGQVIDADGNPIIGTTGGASAQNFTASGGILKVTTTVNGQTSYDFRLDPTAAVVRKWTGLVLPASGNFGTISHGLGTTGVVVSVRDTVSRLVVTSAVTRPNLDGNTIAVEFASPPLSGQYTATVIG